MAMVQAEFIRSQLEQNPNIKIDLVPLSTKGDEILDRSLAKIGGKGLFMKTLEEAMLTGEADFAVHCLKDVPVTLPEPFTLAAYCHRDDPRDCLLSPPDGMRPLHPGCTVGTSSVRRHALLKRAYPDLILRDVRGNVSTRLARLMAGEYDHLVVAAAGIHRLNFEAYIQNYFSLKRFIPAIGQGTLVLECLKNHTELINLLQILNDPICPSKQCPLPVTVWRLYFPRHSILHLHHCYQTNRNVQINSKLVLFKQSS